MTPNPTTAISEIQTDIQALEEDVALYDETNFNKRANAIDFTDFYIIDRIEGLLQTADEEKELNKLKKRAENIKYKLEEIDISLFKQLRNEIKTGIYAKPSFKEMVSKYLGYNVDDIDKAGEPGYDNLDMFINGLLSHQPIPEPTIERGAEMVFYQKTPARIVFEMAAQLKQGDVFFDLGSGLGQVVMIVNLISGATVKGVEYEPVYCNYAKECASQLNLSNVEFINADACKEDLSQGTVFFMYTPFIGSMLQSMMDVLKQESRERTISIFTYGPCSSYVVGMDWLNCMNGMADDPYTLYQFKSLDKSV